MKVAVIGANTPVGARVVIEAEKAGMQVTSVVSTPADLVGNGPIIIKEAHELSREDLSPFHAVVDAVTFPLMHTRALPELPVFYVAPYLAGSSCRYLGFGSCYLLYADSSRTRRVMDCKDMFYVSGELRAHKALEIYEKMRHIAGFNFTLLCPPLRGYIKIIDRKKDMILVSGFNVFPSEIEDVVSRNERIVECAVIGIPSETSGEAVKLIAVRRDPSLTEKELRTWCRQYLTPYKVPRVVEFVETLPKSAVGKVLRRCLRENGTAASKK